MKYTGKTYEFSIRIVANVLTEFPVRRKELELDEYDLLLADFHPANHTDLEFGVAKKVTKTFLACTNRNSTMMSGDVVFLLATGILDSKCGKLDIVYESLEVRVRRRENPDCTCCSNPSSPLGWGVVFGETLYP
jgi:hypothetical protein